jgi:hypothetical protein
MGAIDVFSEHGKELMKTKFNTDLHYGINTQDIEIKYAKEFLSHDGYDKDGPKSNIWTLYVCVEVLETGSYNYYRYETEYWFDNNDKLEYKDGCIPICSKYLVVPYSPGEYFGETQTYYDSMWRIVNNFSDILDNKVSKYDIKNVNIFINKIKIDYVGDVKLE